jgi:hypothetical protein
MKITDALICLVVVTILAGLAFSLYKPDKAKANKIVEAEHPPTPPSKHDPPSPREKFFRGDTVIHKLDSKKGIVVGKLRIGPSGDGTAHDVCRYEVRFASTPIPGTADQPPYIAIKVYEFELDLDKRGPGNEGKAEAVK